MDTQQPSAHELRAAVVRVHGAWDEHWEAVLELTPHLLDGYVRMVEASQRKGALDAKTRELLYLAVDAAVTHLYTDEARMHMENALGYGATAGELLEVMEIASVMGMQSALEALPVLREELLRRTGT
jgi:alkylhydroperoxidase/carboxymuconolactone decarboxylase family protein YurZ